MSTGRWSLSPSYFGNKKFMSLTRQSQSASLHGCAHFGVLRPGASHPNQVLMSLKTFQSLEVFCRFEGNGRFHYVSSLPLVISLDRKQTPTLLKFCPSRGTNIPICEWLNRISLPSPNPNVPQFLLISPERVKETVRRTMDALSAPPAAMHLWGFPGNHRPQWREAPFCTRLPGPAAPPHCTVFRPESLPAKAYA